MTLAIPLFLLFIGCGVAVVLVTRLTDGARRLGELHDELRRNDARLQHHLAQFDQLVQQTHQTPASKSEDGV